MKEKMEAVRKAIVLRGAIAIAEMGTVAAETGLTEFRRKFSEIEGELKSECFRLVVVGRMKNGKSTLLNALLGKRTHPVRELDGAEGPMPMDDLPCTATLTRVTFAEVPHVHLVRFDGSTEEWSFEKYLRSAVSRLSKDEDAEFFGSIREFRMGYPSGLLETGIELIDSPGIDESPIRTEVTEIELDQADVAIVVYTSAAFGSTDEQDFVKTRVTSQKTRTFTVVNLWDGRMVDDRLRALVWNRLIFDEGKGPKFSESDKNFTKYDIYFVDALKALQGRHQDNPILVSESGLEIFEARIADFLLSNRLLEHIERHLNRADLRAESLVNQYQHWLVEIRSDKRKLEEIGGGILEEFNKIRAKGGRIPTIFDRYRRDAKNALRLSVKGMLNQLRNTLSDELNQVKLPSDRGNLFNAVIQKKLVSEAAEACGNIVKTHYDRWGTDKPPKLGAQQALEETMNRLYEELVDEVNSIADDLQEIQVRISGNEPTIESSGPRISLAERLLSAGPGLLLGDLSIIITGGAGGWRGAVGSVVANIAASILLVIIGATSSVIVVPVMIISSIFGAIFGIQFELIERIKDDVVINAKKELEAAEESIWPIIDQEVDRIFLSLQEGVTTQLTSEIHQEEQSLTQLVEVNKLDQEQKQVWADRVESATEQLRKLRNDLKEVIGAAKSMR